MRTSHRYIAAHRTLAASVVMAAALLLSFAPACFAQQNAAKRADDEDVLVLRTYEVGDLVVNIPDYALAPRSGLQPIGGGGGGMGGGGGGFFAVPDRLAQFGGMGGGAMGGHGQAGGGQGGAFAGVPQAASDSTRMTLDALRATFLKVVVPTSWADNGTGKGEVAAIGSTLVVWQTPDVHAQIAEFLNQLRNGSGQRRTVAIDARWLYLNSDEVDALVSPSDSDQPKVDRKQLAALTRRPTSMRGLINCFSGQGVYIISGTTRNVVSSYIPVVGSVDRPERTQLADESSKPRIIFAQLGGGSGSGSTDSRRVGYQPVIEKPNFGALLEIRPTLMLHAPTAVVDLKSTVTFPSDEQPMAEQSPFAPSVDRLAIQMQELSTTLRVKLNEPILVGGLTYLVPGTAIPADSANNEQRQLYLVLELR